MEIAWIEVAAWFFAGLSGLLAWWLLDMLAKSAAAPADDGSARLKLTEALDEAQAALNAVRESEDRLLAGLKEMTAERDRFSDMLVRALDLSRLGQNTEYKK